MREAISRRDNSYLDPSLTQQFIDNPRNLSVISSVEVAIGAYLAIDPSIFAGFLYHPRGIGPETPYFFPKEEDDDPQIQAAARIGVQWKYWVLALQAQEKNSVGHLEVKSTDTFALKILSDGGGMVQKYKTNGMPSGVSAVAQMRGDNNPRYPTYAPSTNYGGDADFYGSSRCRIFPMSVSTSSSELINAESLGLGDEGLVQNTWNSWRGVLLANGINFSTGLELSKKELPSHIQDIISKKGRFNSDIHFFREMLYEGVDYNESMEMYELIKLCVASDQFDNSNLIQNLTALTSNLGLMYETAKEYLGDKYPYE